MNLELIHSVLSACGFVVKLVIHIKPSKNTLTAWAQFADVTTAGTVSPPVAACWPSLCPCRASWAVAALHDGSRGHGLGAACVCRHCRRRANAAELQLSRHDWSNTTTLQRSRPAPPLSPPCHAWPLRCPPRPQVRAALHGQQIPRHLLNEHPTPPVMQLAFANRYDLPVPTQSTHTRWVELCACRALPACQWGGRVRMHMCVWCVAFERREGNGSGAAVPALGDALLCEGPAARRACWASSGSGTRAGCEAPAFVAAYSSCCIAALAMVCSPCVSLLIVSSPWCFA